MRGRIILLLGLLVIFVVGSCGPPTQTLAPATATLAPTATLTPIVTLTPTDHTNQIPFFLTPVKTDPEPGTTQIHFLVDISGSMGMTCGSLGKETQGFVNFAGNLLKREIEDRYQEKVLLGVGTFSNVYESKLQPTFLTKLSSINIKIENNSPRGTTEFTSSIDQAIKEMNSTSIPSTVDHRYLVILTDGETNDVTNVVKHIKQIKDRPVIYVALWCSDKNKGKAEEWMIWDEPTNFRVFRGPEKMLEALLNSLQPYFPAGAKAEVVSSSVTKTSFSGYVTRVSLSYASIVGDNRMDVQIDGTHWSMEPGGFRPYDLSPKPKCLSHEIVLTTHLADGLVFYRPITFESLRGWIRPEDNPGGNLEIVNNNPITLQVEIADAQGSQDLGKWRDCFQISLLDQQGNLLNGMVKPMPCLDGNTVCSTSTHIFGNVEWIPPQYQYQTAKQLEFKVKLGPRNDGTSVYTQYWESEILSIPIKFRANHCNKPRKETKKGVIDYTQLEFDFEFVPNQPPKIFLVTASDERKLDEIGDKVSSEVKLNWARCPSKDALVNDMIAFSPEYCSRLGETPDACVQQLDKSLPLQFTYTIMVYDYVVSKCGFNHLFFIWEENQDAKEVTWECSLLEPNCEPNCDELQKKPTIQK